jgi:hypothetical protein
VMATGEESGQYNRHAGSSNVSDLQLDLLDARLDHVALDLLTEPVVPLLREVRRVRDAAFDALAGRQYPRQSRRLYAIGARACGLLAGVAADRFSLYDAAAQHAETAQFAAELAEDPLLAAWVAGVRAIIAHWQRRYRTAADIAHAARLDMPTGVEAARLAGIEARAWARFGDRDSMRAALADADSARVDPEGVVGKGWLAYPRSNQLRLAGTAHLWIGDYEQAESDLAGAVDLLLQEYQSLAHLAAARADLALAHLYVGHLDQAAEVVHALSTMASGRHLAGAARRSAELHDVLRDPRYASAAQARELIREVEAFAAAQTSDGEAARAGIHTGRSLPQ